MIDAAVEHGGGIDVLINNAANMYRSDVDKYDEAELLAVFHSNVVAPDDAHPGRPPASRHVPRRVIFLGSVHTA